MTTAAASGAILAMPQPLSAARAGQRETTAVVIGAGIAGLSAAYELQKAGFRVTVMEKWDFVGGRMREEQRGPFYGPAHAIGIHEGNREMFDLAREIGILDQLESDKLADFYIVDNGQGLYPLTLRFKIDEVASIPGMSADTRKRIPLLQADLDRWATETDFCDMTRSAAEDTESLQQYYERLLGKAAADEVLAYWIEPVLLAWGWRVSDTSKMALLPWFAQRSGRFIYPRGGMGVLTTKLGSLVPVQLQTSVRFVSGPDASGKRTVHYTDTNGEDKTVVPDIVVCATEGKYIPSIVQNLTPEETDFFNSIFFTKGGGMTFVLDDKFAPAADFGTLYTPRNPDPMKQRVGGWGVSRRRSEPREVPPFARVALHREEYPKFQASGKSAYDYCLPLMQHFYPALQEEHIVDFITDFKDGLAHIPVGHIRKAAQIVEHQQRNRTSLYYAGEFLAGSHTGAACASGRTVGRTIIRHWT